MGQLLGIDFESTAIEGMAVPEFLCGICVAEMGIDIMQNSSPTLVLWELGFQVKKYDRVDRSSVYRIGLN